MCADVGCVSVYWGGLLAVPSMADKPTSTVAAFDRQVVGDNSMIKVLAASRL